MMSTGMAEIYSSATVWCRRYIKVSRSDRLCVNGVTEQIKAEYLVRTNNFTGSHQQMFHGAVLVCDDLFHRGFSADRAATGLNVVLHGCTQTLGLIAIKESHLETVVLIEETIHGSQDDSHR